MYVVLACGSRGWTDAGIVARAMADLPAQTVVVHGGARGADALAQAEARRRGLWVATVPVERHHWPALGKSAGMRRNAAMFALGIKYVIAFHDGVSPGTAATIAMAVSRDIPTVVYFANGTQRKYDAGEGTLF